MTPKPWSPSPDLEGFIPFVVDGNTYQTWYRVFGDLKASTTPLVALHGGPGLTHDYLLPISDLAANGTAVIFYDQLGNGRSTHLPDLPTSFWTVDLFINELVNLLSHFKVDSDFALLGHSWGGILALEFEIRRKPEGLKKLVLSSSLADMKAWNESNARLVQAFPKEIQEAMAVGMKDLKVSGPAMKAFRAVHGCSLKPFPEEYLYSLDQAMIIDPTVGKAMFGGEISAWTAVNRLHLVHPPTLLINGRNDMSQDALNVPFFRNIPKVKWVTLENSSHTPMWEERDKYMRLLADFLNI